MGRSAPRPWPHARRLAVPLARVLGRVCLLVMQVRGDESKTLLAVDAAVALGLLDCLLRKTHR